MFLASLEEFGGGPKICGLKCRYIFQDNG